MKKLFKLSYNDVVCVYWMQSKPVCLANGVWLGWSSRCSNYTLMTNHTRTDTSIQGRASFRGWTTVSRSTSSDSLVEATKQTADTHKHPEDGWQIISFEGYRCVSQFLNERRPFAVCINGWAWSRCIEMKRPMPPFQTTYVLAMENVRMVLAAWPPNAIGPPCSEKRLPSHWYGAVWF